jgi:hypothetical protein
LSNPTPSAKVCLALAASIFLSSWVTVNSALAAAKVSAGSASINASNNASSNGSSNTGSAGNASGNSSGNASSSPGSSQAVAITVYNQNFGLVKDTRNIDLTAGINYLRFEDVAAAIDPTSVSFSSITAPNSVVVREQNYQYDIMDVGTILSKSVGKEIKVRQYTSGGVHETTGTLLNQPVVTISDSNGNLSTRNQSIVLRTSSGIVVGPSGEVELAALPPGLVSKPSLLWKLESDKAGAQKAEISYQTQGLNWKCDYVAVVNADDTLSDLTSWVTLDNKSGATYKNAALKLMAGDVHKVQNVAPPQPMRMYKSAMAAAAQQFTEQSFAEYHLYALAGKTDVNNNETKQLTLFNASAVPIKKLFIFDGGSAHYYGGYNPRGNTTKVNVKLELANSKENNLGMPMPKGKVRVYKKDKDGAMQFVGEDLIDHTPKDEKVRLYLGDAFDIVGERKQLSQQQVNSRVQKLAYEISIRNHKETAVTVNCVEHSSGDWKITSSSQPFIKKDSHTFEFAAKVPANGETKVTYEIEVRY